MMMSFNIDIEKIINLLIENENAISQLYKLFSDKFEGASVFWAGLSIEEKGHASHIRMLLEKVEKGEFVADLKRFDAQIIQQNVEYMNLLIEKFKKESLSLQDALSIAKSIEESIIENNYFNILDKDSIEVKRILQFLKGETESHLRRLQEYRSKES